MILKAARKRLSYIGWSLSIASKPTYTMNDTLPTGNTTPIRTHILIKVPSPVAKHSNT